MKPTGVCHEMAELLPCRVAVIGAGNMAREHFRAFADVPGVTLAGIYSRTTARAESLGAEFGIPTISGSIAELYERSRADLVVVAVSEGAARSVAEACFAFPWTVLLEKPPAIDATEAEALQARAAAAGQRVLVAMNRRFYSSTRAALDDLAAQGGSRYIHVQDQQNQLLDPGPHHTPEVVKNWMYANSIHLIDYLTLFGRGPVIEVTPVYPWNPDEPGVVVARVDFASGDRGLYEGLWNGPGPWAVNVSTPTVRWEMRPLEEATSQRSGTRTRIPTPVHPWDRSFKPGFRRQAEEATAAAQGRASASVSLDDAVATMRLIRDIFQPR